MSQVDSWAPLCLQCSRPTAPGRTYVSTVVVSIGQITLASKMPMKPLYAGLIRAPSVRR